jgi:hypothetical protein
MCRQRAGLAFVVIFFQNGRRATAKGFAGHALKTPVLYECKLHDHERNKLKAAVMRPDSWPVSTLKLGVKCHKNFKDFTENILLNKE